MTRRSRPSPPLRGAAETCARPAASKRCQQERIKAITSITYSVEEPADYWNERGYSRYDGFAFLDASGRVVYNRSGETAARRGDTSGLEEILRKASPAR
jgi:hypothetical protein